MNLNLKNTTTLVAVIASLFATISHADTSATAANTSTSTSTTSAILERTNLLFYTMLEGAPVTNPLSSKQGTPDGDNSKGDPLDFYNIISLRYKNSPVAYFQGDFRFFALPIAGADFSLIDPRIAFGLKDVFQVGPIKLSSLRLRNEIPVTDASREKGRVIDSNLISTWLYDLGESRFTAGVVMETRAFTYSKSNTNENGIGNRRFSNIVVPFVEYQISPKLSTSLSYVHRMANNKGQEPLLKNDLAYFFPNVTYEFAKSWTVAPYMLFYTHNNISLDSSAYGFELTGTVF